MKVCIVGAGYVGLVSGACFADVGHVVACVDQDRRRVDAINSGRAPIHEVGLDDLLTRNAGARLTASTDLHSAVRESEIVLVCVGTPFANGKIDLTQILGAAEDIGRVLRDVGDYKTIIVKSTVVPGTTDGPFKEVLERASGKRAGRDFGLGMNPEFLTEGTAVHDFTYPDRIVLGGIDGRSRDALAELYTAWPSAPRITTNVRTAEMIKYASNSILATMISFSNEIARLCSAVSGIDAVDVMNGVHQAGYFTSQLPDGQRVTAPITSFLAAGCGFGGSCLPKDVSALVAQGKGYGLPMPLLDSVLQVNMSQPKEVLKLVQKHYPVLKDVQVALLGLAFKPDTDDVRESPAFPILRLLKSAGARVTAYDPVARPIDREEMAGVLLAKSMAEAVEHAEVVLLVTRWGEFNSLPDVLKRADKTPLVVDGRRVFRVADFPRFEGIGR